MFVVVNQHAHIAVAGLVRCAVRRQHARVTVRAFRRIEGEAAHVVGEHHLRHGFEHRHFDRLALAGAAARKQRGGDRVDGGEAGDAVGNRQRRITRRRRAGFMEQRRHRRHALDQVVVGGLCGVGSALAETVGADIDDLRVDGSDFFVRQLQPLHRLRPHVIEQYIGGLDQFLQCGQTFGVFQVEHDRALVAVVVQEDVPHRLVPHRRDMAQDVSVRRFDLDDVGAEVTQQLGGKGAQNNRAQVQYTYAVQRLSHCIAPVDFLVWMFGN